MKATTKMILLAVAIVAGWAIWRWRAAADALVPLDLAFRHPFRSLDQLRLDFVAGRETS